MSTKQPNDENDPIEEFKKLSDMKIINFMSTGIGQALYGALPDSRTKEDIAQACERQGRPDLASIYAQKAQQKRPVLQPRLEDSILDEARDLWRSIYPTAFGPPIKPPTNKTRAAKQLAVLTLYRCYEELAEYGERKFISETTKQRIELLKSTAADLEKTLGI
jgi:hypothetical protein